MGPFGDAPQNPLDLGHEAHVGHAVGLVEDQHVEVFDVHLTAVTEVDETTGGGDDDVTAASKRLHLAFNVGPAVDGVHVQSERGPQRFQDLVDLNAEFTSGQEHQTARSRRSALFGLVGLSGGDPLEHGETEPERLA